MAPRAGDNGWTLSGFKATNGVEASNTPHYYIAEFRQYRTYDKGLQTGPYTFGRALTRPTGSTTTRIRMDCSSRTGTRGEANNNTSLHRGEGRALPIDAHPEPLLRDRARTRVRRLSNRPGRARFSPTTRPSGSSRPTRSRLPFSGHVSRGTSYQFFASHPSLPGVPDFNDLNSYWSAAKPDAGVIVPQTGTTIRVVSTSAQDSFMQVHVDPVK